MSEDFSAYLGRFRPGAVLSGYTLEAQIAEGGMAWVFRARHLRLDRLVALKVLKPALASDLAYQRRFVAEARAASAVDDPHIIPVYEADEADGVLFIAMRFIAGGDLSRVLGREGPMPPARAADFVSPVASALDAAHGAGLVHRDVKPANILVDARPGRPDHVYLSDFGVSKAAMSTVNLTGVGDFIGTASYSAPEQFEGKAVDGRIDQYALACVAYQLLTGTVPFKRDTFMSVMMAHVHAPPPALSAQRPDLPAAADAILARALAKNAAERYDSCGDFAEALREAFSLPPYNAHNAAAAPAVTTSAGTASSGVHPPTAVSVSETTDSPADEADAVASPATLQHTMTVGPGFPAQTAVDMANGATLATDAPEHRGTTAGFATSQLPAADLITEVPDPAQDDPEVRETEIREPSGTALHAGTGTGTGTASPVAPGPDRARNPAGTAGWIRRHRLPSIAVACAIAVVAGLIPFTLISKARSPRPTGPTTAASPTTGARSSRQPSPTIRASSSRYTGTAVGLPAAYRRGPLSSLAFGPSGATLAVADGAGTCLWNIAALRCTASLPAARSVTFSPDGTTLATVGGGSTTADHDGVRLWNVATGKQTATLTDPGSKGAYAAAFNADGSTLAVADGNGNTYLWDVFFDKTTTAITGLSHARFDAVAFSPDGTTLALGDAAGSADLVNTGSRQLLFPVTVKHPTPTGVNAVAFSPDGSTLAIGDANGYAYLVNIAARKVIAEMTDPGSRGVNAVAFGPGGATLAVADANGSTYVVDVALKQSIATLTDPGGKGVASVAFSHDGKTLATGDANGSVYFWYGNFG